MQQQTRDPGVHSVIDALEGTDCSYCAEGKLVQGTYKGKDAVVCAACDTPGAQFW